MRRTTLVLTLAAMLALGACASNDVPSSDVSSTLFPSAASQPSTSAGASGAPGSMSPAASASAVATLSARPAASRSATATPTPAATAVCTSAMLTAKVTLWEGAMGSQIATVRLTNASSTTCDLRGTPGLQLVDAGGHVLIDSKVEGASGMPHVSPGDKSWLLTANAWVTTMVQVSNYCGATTPVLPTTIGFLLPSDGGRLVAAAGPGGSAPPCFGSPGDPGVIAMNGWAH